MDGQQPQEAGNANAGNETEFVTQKKSKKFIKFKDFIIKLPNSTGLSNARNPTQLSSQQQSDIEAPFTVANNAAAASTSNQCQPVDFINNAMHGQGGLGATRSSELRGDKGYSIYVVDDEHEIHRFDLDTYEWTIITTTKDAGE